MYKPVIPHEIEERMKNATSGKLPRFFLYAKDKTITQVNNPCTSVVDRLVDKIQHYKFEFQKRELGKFDYKMLMRNKDLEWDEKAQLIADTYVDLSHDLMKYENLDSDAADELYYVTTMKIKNELRKFGTEQYVADVMIKYLFDIHKATHKAMFWALYGSIVYENLIVNRAGNRPMCRRCGSRFTMYTPRQCLCSKCLERTTSIPELPKVAVCFDCGKEFVPENLEQTRCVVCSWMKENPIQTESYGYCSECGAPFDINPRGAGRRSNKCKRCRDNSRRLKTRERNIKYRSRRRD